MIETLFPRSFGASSQLAYPRFTPPQSGSITAETLRFFRIFSDLDEAELAALTAKTHQLTVSARTILLAAGQPGYAVYFLLEGSVKIGLERPTGPRTQPQFSLGKPKGTFEASPATGAQVMLSLCGPGSILGELSVLDGGGHSANVIARETCHLLWMDKDVFLETVREVPSVSLALLHECSCRLRSATHQLHAYATLDAAGRIAHALLRLGESFGTQTPEGLRLDISLTQSELADLTGLTRTRVNTVVASLKQSGCITIEDKDVLVIHDLSRLATVAQNIFSLADSL